MKNVILIPDNCLGYVCGYISWLKFKENYKNTNIYVLTKDLKLANLDINKETIVYLLGHILDKDDMLYISKKSNIISVIDKSKNITESDIEGVYNINLIHSLKSTIRTCWEELIDNNKEMPKALQLLEEMYLVYPSDKAINFSNGINKLDLKTNYEYWDKMSNDNIMIDRIIELGSNQ